MRACGRCLDREDSNVHLTEMRSVSLISCLPKMWPSSSTSTGSQIATWRRSLAWTRREFSHYLRSLLTEKMFVWPPASLTELGSARYSSAPSITTVWSNYQTSYNDSLKSTGILNTVTLYISPKCSNGAFTSLTFSMSLSWPIILRSHWSNRLQLIYTVKVGHKYVNVRSCWSPLKSIMDDRWQWLSFNA